MNASKKTRIAENINSASSRVRRMTTSGDGLPGSNVSFLPPLERWSRDSLACLRCLLPDRARAEQIQSSPHLDTFTPKFRSSVSHGKARIPRKEYR